MTDTIEMLETIGRSASLRHASTEELAKVLERAHASEVLVSAVAQGDSSMLSAALGSSLNQVPQVIQIPAREEEEPEQEDEEEPLGPAVPHQ